MDAAIAWGFTESAQERERDSAVGGRGREGKRLLGAFTHVRACADAAATAVLAIWFRLIELAPNRLAAGKQRGAGTRMGGHDTMCPQLTSSARSGQMICPKSTHL